MITNFALSLSFEGIELLHRVQRGWRRIGRADVASDTLEADLADLRKKAEELAPGGLATKLIIPLDQIKYTAIDGTLTTQSDIDAKLEGATPYALDELVIDCERFGGRTHIAAVARETLKEAEVFAAAHGFNPVSFVAVPEPFTFQKEVFFGPTEMMPSILGPDAEVTRDEMAVMIVGTRIKSRLLVFDLPEEVEEEVYKDDLTELLSGSFKPSAAKEEDNTPPEVVEDSAPEDRPETNITDEIEVVDEVSLAEDEPEILGDTDASAEDATATPKQAIWVDHIPAEYHAPPVSDTVLVHEAEVADEAIEVSPVVALVPENPELFVPALFDTIIAEVHPQAAQAPKATLRAAPDAGSINAPKLGVIAPTANRDSAPTQTGRSKAPLIIAVAASLAVIVGGVIWSQQQATTEPTAQEASLAPDVATAIAENVATPQIAPTPDEPVVATLEAGPIIPEVSITDFGVDDTDGGALPAFTEATTAQTGTAPSRTLFAAPDQPLAAVQNPPAPEPAPAPAPEVAQASVGAPVLRGTVLSPADAERIYAATGVWQRSPRFLDVPSGVIAFDFQSPESYEAPSRVSQPQVPPLTGLETDLSFLAPADPPPATAVFARDESGFIQATPEGTLTPDGALVIAGLPDLVINPRPDLTQEQLDRMALLAPAPEGVDLIAGSPDVIPPLRPANAQLPTVIEEAVAEAATPDTSAITQPTPGSVGIAGLELQNDGSLALDSSTVEDTSETDLRPLLRPQELASAVDPGTPDITDIIAGLDIDDATLRFDNSTRLAVVLSVRPDRRPSNFENTVAAAQARLVTAPTVSPAAPAPVTAAAPVPRQNFGPVPGGVARAATQEDVIRLRDINLIGVYGRPNARRALVRLSNGSYVRVEIGSALDGGQVTAIGDDALNYVKRGRTYAIELPSG